jgi:hypothetical protein
MEERPSLFLTSVSGPLKKPDSGLIRQPSRSLSLPQTPVLVVSPVVSPRDLWGVKLSHPLSGIKGDVYEIPRPENG